MPEDAVLSDGAAAPEVTGGTGGTGGADAFGLPSVALDDGPVAGALLSLAGLPWAGAAVCRAVSARGLSASGFDDCEECEGEFLSVMARL